MLLELILLGLVVYLLLAWHRKEVEKGGEGLGAAGPILEELENFCIKIVDIFKNKANTSTSKRGTLSGRANVPDENPSPQLAPAEKFESVRQPKEKSRSKHHSRHRSKLDSALKASQQ
uniref:Secreted protein n=1 Tax=Caenorhabditis tropicalis TaxID=1561998 RepID=A0A1I7TM98_9PELO